MSTHELSPMRSLALVRALCSAAALPPRLRPPPPAPQDFAREGGYSLIFERMSNKLRADTAMLIGEAHVQLVWYLRVGTCESGFLCEVALNLKPSVYEIQEHLPIRNLVR